MGNRESELASKHQQYLKWEHQKWQIFGNIRHQQYQQPESKSNLLVKGVELKSGDLHPPPHYVEQSSRDYPKYQVRTLRKFNKLQGYRAYLLSMTPRFAEETRLIDSILKHMGMTGVCFIGPG